MRQHLSFREHFSRGNARTNTSRALSRPNVTQRIIAAIGVIIGSSDARVSEPGR
jgi:hypothetical protein